jgi:hypothetical protein
VSSKTVAHQGYRAQVIESMRNLPREVAFCSHYMLCFVLSSGSQIDVSTKKWREDLMKKDVL